MGDGFSMELCGGTHVDNTAKVGVFHIHSEFSVASGVRRIEATTGLVSLEVMNRNQELLFQAAAALKAKPGELRERAEAVMNEIKQLHQAVEKFKAREAVSEAERFLFAAHDVGGLKVLTATVPDADADRLRKMGDFLRDKDPPSRRCWPPSTGRRSPSWPSAARTRWPRASRPGTSSRPSPPSAAARAAASPTPPWAAAAMW